MKLFIDVNGTITSYVLKEIGPNLDGQGLKHGVTEFFDWATQNFDCYWLSNLVPRGMMFGFKREVLPILPESAKKVKAGHFARLKTEAITDGDFLWLDDNLLQEEKAYLEEHGWLNNFIHVDHDATSMAPVISEIKRRMHRPADPGPEGVAGNIGPA